jgi:hypothetical protein
MFTVSLPVCHPNCLAEVAVTASAGR